VKLCYRVEYGKTDALILEYMAIKMKTKFKLITIVLTILVTLSCKAQQDSIVSKVENNLGGDIDYAKEELQLTLTQINGDEIVIGKIANDGTINITLPEIDIKALHDEINMGSTPLDGMFEMTSCIDKKAVTESKYEDVSSYKYDLISISKYGISVAYLAPVSRKDVLNNNQYSSDILTTGSKYYFFNTDTEVNFKKTCDQNSFYGKYDIEMTRSGDIQFKKGWNFIKETLVETQEYAREDYHTPIPKIISYTSANSKDADIKWYIEKLADDDEIQFAKKLHSFTPLTKDQFMKWVPKKLGNLSVTLKEHGNPSDGEKSKNSLHLIYANDAQEKEIDIYIVDCAKSPLDMEMVNYVYAMSNDGKDKKDIKPYVTQYREQENTTKFIYKFNDRLAINAVGHNINPDELWDYVKKLNLEKLIP